MPIKISEHILSLDESILGVSFFSNKFHVMESAVRHNFERRFQVSKNIEGSSPAYAAAIYGMVKLLEEPFGNVEKITVDYGRAKLMLLALRNKKGFLGLVLNRSVNSEYLIAKISEIVKEADEELDALV